MAHVTYFKADLPSRFDVKQKAKQDAEAAWKAVCKVVDTRDGRQCRCCDKRSDPNGTGLLTRGHRHHIKYRSAGGQDISSNLVTLCAVCHYDEHHHRMFISGGDADGPLCFWRYDEWQVPYIVREEIAVRVVRRD